MGLMIYCEMTVKGMEMLKGIIIVIVFFPADFIFAGSSYIWINTYFLGRHIFWGGVVSD